MDRPSSAKKWIEKLEQKINRAPRPQQQPPSASYHNNIEYDALVLLDSHAPVWSLADFDIGKKLVGYFFL